ncbi:MAG TPA: DUF2189 domain-containing protein [Microvirga sp.]|nr:DUF2189 domain-containing protein [Microvirga sp.]
MASFHVLTGPDATLAQANVRKIGFEDLKYALTKGVDDFMAMPTHLVFLGLIYPLFGIGLGAVTFSTNALQLIFPLVSGFALMGPLAAVGLYELSRRREMGLDTSPSHVFDVLRSPSLPAIVALGIVLMIIFTLWLMAAQALYAALYGSEPPQSYIGFIGEVLTTARGWALIVLGHVIGFVFAAAVFCISVVSFPLLLDRDVGATCAVQTSIKAVMTNPRPMALWALIIAALLIIGSAPLMVGLAIVMPVLGHASWHLYRRTVDPPGPMNPPPAP